MRRDDIGAIVLFSGPGGSSLGLRNAGVTRSVGVEYEPNAVATARAAGFDVIQADVRTLDPREVLSHLWGGATGLADAAVLGLRKLRLLLQSSPPCQGLSAAGKGVGRQDLEHLLAALNLVGQMPPEKARQWTRWYGQQLVERCSDERSPLTFETIRWIADLLPDFISLEQVPAALPIWQAIAEVLVKWGYSVWTGNVQAEQFGVPQTRKRALLLAARIQGLDLTPVPTHSRYYSRDPQKLDPGVPKWVSMAEALEWGPGDVVQESNYSAGGKPGQTAEERGRGHRDLDAPSSTLTSKAARWVYRASNQAHAAVRDCGAPAPTLAFGHATNDARWYATRDDAKPGEPMPAADRDGLAGTESLSSAAWGERSTRDADQPAPTVTGSGRNVGFAFVRGPVPAIEGETAESCTWVQDRPSPTIVGSFAPEVVAKPGYRKAGDPPRQRTPGSVRVTVQEAGVLQSFDRDHPWQGTKTRQYGQVGNAVPPLLQQRMTEQLLTKCDTERRSNQQAA